MHARYAEAHRKIGAQLVVYRSGGKQKEIGFGGSA